MHEEPIHPRNLWLRHDLGHHAEVDEIYRQNIPRLIERGTFTPPAHEFPGSRYQQIGEGSPAEDWERSRHLWDSWGES